MTKNLLFICSRNQWRSPTAERLWRNTYHTRSAGTSPRAQRTVSTKDIQWADVIFCMEHHHKQRITSEFRQALQHTPIHVLDIPDEYHYMDPELIALLEQSIPSFIRSE